MAYSNPEDQRAYSKLYYQKNKRKRLDRQNTERKAWREYIKELKGNTPCLDCGVQYPSYVMQFDHVRGTKKNDIAQVAKFGSFKAVLAEIEKCEIVCANCHAIRTHTRKSMGHSQVG